MLPTTLCATVFTTDCILSTGGTVTIDLIESFSNADKTQRVWQGFGKHSPDPTARDWYVQIMGICDTFTGEVTWYLCHDACLDDAFKCPVDPPDVGSGDWLVVGVTTPAQECIFATHFGVPISSCNDAGDYDCVFELTVTEGACP